MEDPDHDVRLGYIGSPVAMSPSMTCSTEIGGVRGSGSEIPLHGPDRHEPFAHEAGGHATTASEEVNDCRPVGRLVIVPESYGELSFHAGMLANRCSYYIHSVLGHPRQDQFLTCSRRRRRSHQLEKSG